MTQNLVDLANNIDFHSLWQGLTDLPLITKVLGFLVSIAPIITLIVNLPKAYSQIRGAVAKIEIKRFNLVEREIGLVDFQLDICVRALHKNIVLEGIFLKNKNEFFLLYNELICLYNEPPDNDMPSNMASLKLAIPKVDSEFTQFVENKFVELFLTKLSDSKIDILGLEIPQDSFKCLTMVGRLKGKIIDGYNFSNIPLKEWSLILEYGGRKTEIVLKPLFIDNSLTRTQ
jgi:hypothetical protein